MTGPVVTVESTAASSGSRNQSRALPVTYPMLTDSNYGAWSVQMKLVMEALGIWEAVDGEGTVKVEKDRGAFALISQAIPDPVMMSIAEKKTTKEAWYALKEMQIGEERVKNANVKVLKRNFDRMITGETEAIADFALKMTNTVNEIRSLGCEMTDKEIVEKLFRSVPDSSLPIVGTIQQWGDMNKITVGGDRKVVCI